jgi:hypothetical protein
MGGTTNARRGDLEALTDTGQSINENYSSTGADIDGDSVDTAPQGNEYNGVKAFVSVANGASGDTVTITVQESADDSTWSDLTDKNGNKVQAQVDGTNTTQELSFVDAPKHKRYLRLQLDDDDTQNIAGSSIDLFGGFELGAKKFAP